MVAVQVPAGDAEELEGHFGVGAAIGMLHDGLVAPKEFFWLCAEAADALDCEVPRPQQMHRRACTAMRETRTEMSVSAWRDASLRLIDEAPECPAAPYGRVATRTRAPRASRADDHRPPEPDRGKR
jgi:hypothetical protein